MARSRRKAQADLNPAALDTLIDGVKTAEDVDELFRQMKKALMERVLNGELTHHLGYARGEMKPAGQANHRNGSTPKTVLSDEGAIPLAIPRDRAGTFEPQLVPKNARRLPRFDQNVLSLYARGMSVRGIREHRRGPWKGFDDVEYATPEWVAWFNTQRLLEPLGYLPPAEYVEQFFYRAQAAQAVAEALT